jgi:hypothetical protein
MNSYVDPARVLSRRLICREIVPAMELVDRGETSVSGYQVGGHRHAGSDGTRGRADSDQYRRESDPKNA